MKMGENYCHFAARNLLDNWTIYNLQFTIAEYSPTSLAARTTRGHVVTVFIAS